MDFSHTSATPFTRKYSARCSPNRDSYDPPSTAGPLLPKQHSPLHSGHIFPSTPFFLQPVGAY